MPYSYDENLIREIRESTDIVAIISEYVELKNAGSNMKGLCPFHNEKTPSMVVSPSKQMFRCFGCGEGGDVITFLMKYRNADFMSIIEELATRANIELRQRTDKDIERDKRRELIYEINREAAIFYYKNLSSTDQPQLYLKKRGIKKETVRRFGIGYSLDRWDGLLNHLKSKNYSLEDIEKTGLIIKHREKNSHYDRFRGRVIFPIWNINSKIIGFGGRLLKESDRQPKYLNSPDTEVFLKGKNLYGLNLIKDKLRGKRVILVEGYMDVIALAQNGIYNSVASLGTALTSDQVKLIKRYTEDIAIAYDFDGAGINASKKAIGVIKREGITPKVVKLELGMDPDDYINTYGVGAFEERVETASHYMDFLIGLKLEENDMQTLEGRLSFANSMKPYLKEIKSPVEADIYLSRIAELVRVDRESIKRELGIYSHGFKRSRENNYRPRPIPNQTPVLRSELRPDIRMELELLKLLFEARDLEQLKEIGASKFSDKLNAELIEHIVRQGDFDLEGTDASEEVKSRAREIGDICISLEKDKFEKAISDYRKKLSLRYLDSRKKKILEEIKSHESGSEKSEESTSRFKELCRQLTEIDKNMKSL